MIPRHLNSYDPSSPRSSHAREGLSLADPPGATTSLEPKPPKSSELIKTKEDYVLWLKILKKKQYAYPINDYLTYWRDTDNSLSSNKLQKIYDGYKVYRKYLKFSPFKSIIYLFK